GKTATITAATPKYQYGLEILWAPAYGKDSLGIQRVIHSDTFLKVGVAQVHYDTDTGMRFVAGIGKSFFLSSWLAIRVTANGGIVQTIVDGVKSNQAMALVEAGTV